MFEIIVENCLNGNARLVVIEENQVTGLRNIRDVYEGSVDYSETYRHFGNVVELLASDGDVKLYNENIDLGRAKRWESKMKKIITTLVNEGRGN